MRFNSEKICSHIRERNNRTSITKTSNKKLFLFILKHHMQLLVKNMPVFLEENSEFAVITGNYCDTE